MACELCVKDPNSHSFSALSPVNDIKVFYTAPARALDRDHPEKLEFFRKHLVLARNKPWIWIFDCGEMAMQHYAPINFTLGLSKILEEEHGDVLQSILVIRPNWFTRCTLNILKAILPNKTLEKVVIIPEVNPMPALSTQHGLSLKNITELQEIFETPLPA